MNSFAHLLSEDRRLVILRILEKAPGSEANHYLLREALDSMGHNVSRDVVMTELSWLAEQGLVTLEDLGSMKVAALTGRGQDVALGRAVVPGVKKPVPGE
jgi:DNA-binding transcriptional ArsR family regulator